MLLLFLDVVKNFLLLLPFKEVHLWNWLNYGVRSWSLGLLLFNLVKLLLWVCMNSNEQMFYLIILIGQGLIILSKMICKTIRLILQDLSSYFCQNWKSREIFLRHCSNLRKTLLIKNKSSSSWSWKPIFQFLLYG